MNEPIYQVVATVHDPRTAEGMQEQPAYDVEKQDRTRATGIAQKWAEDGYWASIYDQKTAECIVDFAPKGGRR